MKVLSNNINMMKSFKNRGMETGYFTKIFEMSPAYKEWTKNISKEDKKQGKKLKATREKNVEKIKKKKVFYLPFSTQ